MGVKPSKRGELPEMKKPTKKEIQTALKVLMFVNSDKSSLEKFKTTNGLHLIHNAQSSIAECFRFLVVLRDDEV